MLDDGQQIVREHIRPKQIIAVHISPSEGEKVTEQIKQVFPDAVAFTTLLERGIIDCEGSKVCLLALS